VYNIGSNTIIIIASRQESPMSTLLSPHAPPTEWTFADVQARLGGIPPNRIRTYPETRTARAYTSADRWQEIAADGVLSGGQVLPGFELSLKKVFGWAERRRV
jgi:hypothetical protein